MPVAGQQPLSRFEDFTSQTVAVTASGPLAAGKGNEAAVGVAPQRDAGCQRYVSVGVAVVRIGEGGTG